jgi:plastocyanin
MNTRHHALLTAGLIMALAAAALAGCSQHPADTVIIHDLQFDPTVITVSTGTTVTWVNKDQIPVQVQSDNYDASTPAPGQFSSEPLNPKDEFSLRFDATGDYPYFDPFHPYITGTVVVR